MRMARNDITEILIDLSSGKQRAADELLPAIYDELRALAQAKLEYERIDHTLQPTALVHEAYMKLVDQNRVDWKGRTHFFAVSAQAMRRILIDHARRKNREKRGKNWRRIRLDDAFSLTTDHHVDLLALDEAMERMRKLDERQAEIIDLRLFGGMTIKETAALLDTSPRTVQRDWKMGLTWLRRELSEGTEHGA